MFEKIWKKILRRDRLSLWAIPAFLLWLCSLLYRVLIRLRQSNAVPIVRLDIPVISVGNITVGGSGKTPIVELLARFFLNEGKRVGIISSGYDRSVETSFVEPGYKVQQRPTDETGDEVKLLARLLPEAVFSVDRSKAAAAQRLAEMSAVDLAIVDDGFQHTPLARDVDIVTYDAAVDENMLRLFPYGVLREPMSSLQRADIIIITRAKFTQRLKYLEKELRGINPQAWIYSARFEATELIGHDRRRPVKYLEDKSVFLFAGVGNFRPLKQQVVALCTDLDFALELSDHQRYDRRLLKKIKSMAEKFDSDVIITTGKDWVKLGDFDFGREIYYLSQSVDLDPGEEKLIAELQRMLELKRKFHKWSGSTTF
ncbi:MAG: tetraacyldisaccharide 4'-kinase [Candidatus Zixiibacteriota bacterium]